MNAGGSRISEGVVVKTPLCNQGVSPATEQNISPLLGSTTLRASTTPPVKGRAFKALLTTTQKSSAVWVQAPAVVQKALASMKAAEGAQHIEDALYTALSPVVCASTRVGETDKNPRKTTMVPSNIHLASNVNAILIPSSFID
jgi:hypothetical protein